MKRVKRREKMTWISVKDRLPEIKQRVLLAINKYPDSIDIGTRYNGYWMVNDEWFIQDEDFDYDYWMPRDSLPPLPL